MNTRIFLMAALMMCAVAEARTFRWVDEHGKVHYGDTLPSQAERTTEYSKNGRPVRALPVKAEEPVLSAEEEQLRRRDRALLATYTKPEEIDLARDRSLEIIDLAIKGSEARMKVVRARMDELNAQQARIPQGKPMPEGLARDLFETRKELDGLMERVRVKALEQDEVRARYMADRERFMQLSGAR